MENRNINIDLLKGVAIILMVFDHVGWNNIVHTYIQSFHMPLFFIVSGYLWKERPIKKKTITRTKRLLVPYCSMSLIYFVIAIIFNRFNIMQFNILNMLKALIVYPTDMPNMPFAPALWFLPCMFLTNFIYDLLSLKTKEKTKHIIVLSIASLGSIYSHYDLPILPFCIEPFCAALLFFDIGYIFKKYKIKNYFKSNYLIFILLMLAHIVLTFLNIGSVDMRSARYHIVPLYFINGCLGTYAFYYGIQLIRSMKLKKYLSWFGQNTMQFLCFNQFFIMIFQILIYRFIKADWNVSQIIINMFVFVMSMVACMMTGFFISKTKLKFLLGKS